MSKFPEIMKNRTASGWTDSLKEIDSAGEKNDEYTVKNGAVAGFVWTGRSEL